MQFTLYDCNYQNSPISLGGLLALSALLLLIIGPPLVLWLRKGYRDPHDVLSVGSSPRRGLLLRTREVFSWLGCLGALTAVPFLATSVILQLEVFSGDIRDFTFSAMIAPRLVYVFVTPWTRGYMPLEPAWLEIALAHGVAFALLVWWQRTPRRSDEDVLRVTANSNP